MQKILYFFFAVFLIIGCARQADVPEPEKIIPTPQKIHYYEDLIPVWSPDVDSAMC